MNVLIFICLCFGYLFIKIKNNVLILQQNFYNENYRYLKWGIKNIFKAFNICDILLCLFNLCNLIVKYESLLWVNILYLGLTIYYFIKLKREIVKLPLVITNRVKRLFVTIFIFYMLPLIVVNNIYLICFIYSGGLVINFLVVLLANVCNKPIEKLIYYHYKRMALKKLTVNKDMLVIGITGSYGKTSCKNILNEILSVKYKVLMTPKNYNTAYGLIMTINNYLDKFDEVFIAEMGAFKLGSINRLCKLVKPKYGIITNIGLAHLETFHTRENIQTGKFELAEALPNEGLIVLNIDDEYQVNYQIKNNVKVIWVGIDNKSADVWASEVIVTDEGSNFKVSFKDDNNKYLFETKLLGKHNIYNILSAIAIGKYMGLSISELQFGVKMVRTIPHRLEIKQINDMVIIDDSYNSNPVGAHMALDILKLMNGIRIVVTPGMIELGSMEEKYNKNWGKYMSMVADYVILIGKRQTKDIYDGLMCENYSEDNIFIKRNIQEAFNIIKSIEGKKYILLENDLPDIFNEN